jgi:hypothetical protein
MYSRDPRRFTRRDFLKTTAMAGAGLALAACNAAPSASTTGNIKGITINYLGWEGYDYEEALKPLTDPNNIVVNSTYGGSNDEIFSKLKAGGPGQYDVVSIYHGTIASMVQNNLLQPLDTSRLTYLGAGRRQALLCSVHTWQHAQRLQPDLRPGWDRVVERPEGPQVQGQGRDPRRGPAGTRHCAHRERGGCQ